MSLAWPMSWVVVSQPLLPIPTTRTLLPLKSDGLVLIQYCPSREKNDEIPFESLHVQDLSLEAFLASKFRNDSFRGKSTTDSYFIKISYLCLSRVCDANLPFCVVGIALDSVDGCVELDVMGQVKMFGVRFDVVACLRGCKMGWKVWILIRMRKSLD